MAKRANTGTPEYTQLVSIQLGWDQKLRVPNELMSPLAGNPLPMHCDSGLLYGWREVLLRR